MYKFTKIESYSISTIRAISVLMIFFCHILQGIDSIMAWWLNVGVQIFLFMSGFLISSKEINNFYKFIKERLKKIFPILKEKFGEPKAALEFETPYQLMVAVILSAQCTDARVNIVTKELFKVVKEPADIRKMNQETLEKYIKSTGFYKNKAKNIKLNAEMMLDKYKDIIPKKLEELIELPGVGRKTANVVLGELWNIREGIVVDTHVKRLSNRIGFVKNDNPEIIERELMKFIPKKYWFVYSHYLILHGRDKCIARKPKCEICEIRDYCKYNEENLKKSKINN